MYLFLSKNLFSCFLRTDQKKKVSFGRYVFIYFFGVFKILTKILTGADSFYISWIFSLEKIYFGQLHLTELFL